MSTDYGLCCSWAGWVIFGTKKPRVRFSPKLTAHVRAAVATSFESVYGTKPPAKLAERLETLS